jgi:hypothetical protein
VPARFEKGLRVRVLGVLENARCRPIFDDGAVVHDRDPVTDLADHFEVVRNQDHRELVSMSQLGDQIEDLCLYRHVEGGDRFIEDQQTRPGRESPGDGDTLSFATRKLRWASIRNRRRQSDLIEKLGDAFSAFGRIADGVCDERLGDDGADSKARIEGETGILEHGLEAPPQGSHP